MTRIPALIVTLTLLAGCASGERQMADPNVAATVDVEAMQAMAAMQESPAYRIGATDKLRLNVFQVEDLSFDEIFVDASGNLQLPMIGTVRAAGLTPDELSTDMERRLAERYLKDPQVTVTVIEAASQKVTVDGAVTKPGVYEMRGRTTLLQAVAMAEGPTPVAQLRSVAVFRTINGRRSVAVFDLAAIRGGQSADPLVLGDDIIVVDTSRLNARMREIIAALPGFAAFAYL